MCHIRPVKNGPFFFSRLPNNRKKVSRTFDLSIFHFLNCPSIFNDLRYFSTTFLITNKLSATIKNLVSDAWFHFNLNVTEEKLVSASTGKVTVTGKPPFRRMKRYRKKQRRIASFIRALRGVNYSTTLTSLVAILRLLFASPFRVCSYL